MNDAVFSAPLGTGRVEVLSAGAPVGFLGSGRSPFVTGQGIDFIGVWP